MHTKREVCCFLSYFQDIYQNIIHQKLDYITQRCRSTGTGILDDLLCYSCITLLMKHGSSNNADVCFEKASLEY